MQVVKLTPYEKTLIGQYLPGSEVIVFLDTEAASFTVQLPDAFSTQGTKFSFTTIGGNSATIVPIKGQFINNSKNIVINQYENAGVCAYSGIYYRVQ